MDWNGDNLVQIPDISNYFFGQKTEGGRERERGRRSNFFNAIGGTVFFFNILIFIIFTHPFIKVKLKIIPQLNVLTTNIKRNSQDWQLIIRIYEAYAWKYWFAFSMYEWKFFKKTRLIAIIIQLHKVEYKWQANRVQISCDIARLFGQLVILNSKKTCLTSPLRATLYYPLFFSRPLKIEQKDRWIINNLWDILVYGIAGYFQSLFVNSEKYSAILHTKTCNKIYLSL